MPLFFPIMSGVATVLTAALTYETCKSAHKKMQKKRRKKENGLRS